MVQIQQRRYQEAIASLERAADLGVFYPHAAAGLALAHAKAGDRAAAMRVVRDLERRRAGGELVPPIMIAVGYAGLDDATRGLEWFNRGIDEKDVYIPENLFEPLLDPLRNDPRFAQILHRMGLEPAAAGSTSPGDAPRGLWTNEP
jgi:hypothetical protein